MSLMQGSAARSPLPWASADGSTGSGESIACGNLELYRSPTVKAPRGMFIGVALLETPSAVENISFD